MSLDSKRIKFCVNGPHNIPKRIARDPVITANLSGDTPALVGGAGKWKLETNVLGPGCEQ